MDKLIFDTYIERLNEVTRSVNMDHILSMATSLRQVWERGGQVFICGNGGSAANAIHMANDFLYGIAKDTGRGLRVNALPANQSVLTCLANDISYDEIFSTQIKVYGQRGDILIALSGSGNSKNIIRAIESAKEEDIKTFAILGYSGGRCLDIADVPIHFKVDDMQIAEDMQLIVGHMVMQWLRSNPVK